MVISRALAARGHEIQTVRDGEEALRRIRRTPPDLVILDLGMPVMDGWQVLGRLHGLAGAPPVVVVSADPGRDRALGEGAAACVPKPFGLGQLVKVCEKLLGLGLRTRR